MKSLFEGLAWDAIDFKFIRAHPNHNFPDGFVLEKTRPFIGIVTVHHGSCEVQVHGNRYMINTGSGWINPANAFIKRSSFFVSVNLENEIGCLF